MVRYVCVVLVACSFEHGRSPVDAPAVSDSEVDVPVDVPVDALVDARCPDSYTTTIGASAYRVIATAAAFAPHHAACNADRPGRTHLASLETAGEITALQQALIALAPGQYYVGAVQQPNQPTTEAGWFVFTGGPLPPGLFGSSNDDNPGENNEENLGAFSTTDFFHDVTGDVAYPAVCECDGLPIDPTVATYIP